MNGELVVVDDVPAEFAACVVDAYDGRVDEYFSIALSGGDTARRCYERLAEVASERIDWWAVDFYWGDERCVPSDSPESNERIGREALLERADQWRQVVGVDASEEAQGHVPLVPCRPPEGRVRRTRQSLDGVEHRGRRPDPDEDPHEGRGQSASRRPRR